MTNNSRANIWLEHLKDSSNVDQKFRIRVIFEQSIRAPFCNNIICIKGLEIRFRVNPVLESCIKIRTYKDSDYQGSRVKSDKRGEARG